MSSLIYLIYHFELNGNEHRWRQPHRADFSLYAHDTAAFKSIFKSLEISLNTILEWMATAVVLAAKMDGRYGTQYFAEEFGIEHVSVSDKWDPGDLLRRTWPKVASFQSLSGRLFLCAEERPGSTAFPSPFLGKELYRHCTQRYAGLTVGAWQWSAEGAYRV